jgi:predicted ATPase
MSKLVMNKLDRIQVSGFKSIGSMDLSLNSLNVLIGANGAGKSNFIGVFDLLNQIVEERLQLFVGKAGGADALLHFGRKTTEEIVIHTSFGRNAYEVGLTSAAQDTLIFSKEIAYYHYHGQQFSQLPSPYPMGSGHKETRLYEEPRRFHGSAAIADSVFIENHVLKNLKSWKVYHFHDTSDNAPVKQTGDMGDNALLRADAANLAAFLYLLQEKHPDNYARLVKTIRLAAPFFDDFVLRPSPLNPNKILLEWREVKSDAYFNVHALSDGTLRFICLATLLLQPNLPTTIIIDEPELGLHPYAIVLLASLMRGAATQTQVIVSTQSVSLVNQFAPEDIIIVDREAGQSTFKRLDTASIENWLEEYGLGELWEKNILGGRPHR